VVAAALWFDPACPWTWLTARWLLEAERVRDLRVQFNVMSLALLNGIEPSQDGGEALWGPVRVAMAAHLSYGDAGVRRAYIALATLIHEEEAGVDRELYATALHRALLPHTLAYAANSPYYDAEIEASHRRGLAPVGTGGCPVLHLPGPDGELVAFFGPVVTPSPRGEAAGRLWDSVALAASTDGFFELKRQRDRSPIFD
jgi:hypothetical protein